jgi:hypothetical protein
VLGESQTTTTTTTTTTTIEIEEMPNLIQTLSFSINGTHNTSFVPNYLSVSKKFFVPNYVTYFPIHQIKSFF